MTLVEYMMTKKAQERALSESQREYEKGVEKYGGCCRCGLITYVRCFWPPVSNPIQLCNKCWDTVWIGRQMLRS
jgi:hypothetical protein